MLATAGASRPGMKPFLDRMGSAAKLVTANSATLDAMSTFMGPQREGASARMQHIEHMLAHLTNVPNHLMEYAKSHGLGEEQAYEVWKGIVNSVAAGGSSKASFDFGSSSPLAGGFMPPTMMDQYRAKYDAMQYITSNLQNPSAEFAQEMTMMAMLPIVKEMIPNTVATKAFITDNAVGQLSKPYVIKENRSKAYQQGLAEEVSHLPPTEVRGYNPILVTPTEWKRPTNVDMKYIETMEFDVPADNLSDAGKELQVLIDTAFFKALDVLVPNNGAAPAAGSTTNGFSMDDTGTVMTLEADMNPQVEHLNFANQLLRNRGYNPDLIITSPFELAVLMGQQAVLMAYAFGSREVQETGQVGTLVGDAVAWTPNLWQNSTASSLVIWVVDSDELARIVLGWPISLYTDLRLRRLDFELYARLALLFRNCNAVIKIVCDNADAGIS